MKFSAQYSPNYGRCEQIKIAKTLFDVSKQVFPTAAVMFFSFRKSPVAHPSTNRNGPEKSRGQS